MREAALAICLGLLLQGCGKDRPDAPPRDGGPSGTSQPAPSARPAPPTTGQAPASTRPVAGAAAQTQPVRTTRPTQPAAAPAEAGRLDAALEEILRLEKLGEFAQAWKLAMETRSRFAADPRLEALQPVTGRLRTEKGQAAQLAQAVKLLGSDVAEAAQIAASELAAGGEVGAILLRRAVRTEPEAVAAQATRVLVRLNDAEAPPALYQRLQAAPDGPLRSVLLDGLRSLAQHLRPPVLGELYRQVGDGDFARHHHEVGILAAAFAKAADGDAERFARLVGDAQAHAKLKALATAALTDKDQAVAAAAAAAVADLGAMLRGLRGSYYDGRDFQKLLFERLDPRIDIPSRKLPYPDGRQEERSIRWTGQVRVPVDGEYTFYAAADDGVRLWVDDSKIIDRWADQAVTEFEGKVNLSKGLHPIRLEYYQGGGECEVHLSFRGPSIDKQVLDEKHLLTTPWQDAATGQGAGKE